MAHSASHSRSHSMDDDDDVAPTGSAYQLILDHILTYPGAFEIPLRTMYALNCAPHTRHAKSHHSASSTSSAGSSRHSPASSQTVSFQDKQVTQTFTENLMAQIAQCSNQPTSLPPSFVLAFLKKCFPPELVRVDFPQALTGLDYLKDLEARRRREVSSAVARLGIDRKSVKTCSAALAESPSLVPWLRTVEEKERKIEYLYTQLYLGLRRWILINELSLLPFHKHNCVAMLNTLYPPMRSSPPTSKLTHDVLKAQREGFFKYINFVEKCGPRVLENLQKQGAAPGEENGWVAITRCLNQYLQLAMSIIYECAEIVDVADIGPTQAAEPTRLEKPARKADSGISFTSNIEAHRPSSQGSAKSPISPTSPTRPKNMASIKGGTTLEKLARGLRTIGRNRVDATEIIDTVTAATHASTDKPRGLKKMRSLGSLDRTIKSNTKTDRPTFDAEEMRRQRYRYEATVIAEQKFGHHHGNEP